jgi:hypothetical protein
MRYLVYLASSFIAFAIFYYSLIFALFPTPVAAEYWVRELLVFKRDIAKNLAGQPKIIVASGSSTLFNVDTNILSAALKRPTINLGLMGGLPLDTILEEVNTVSMPGDLVIMALEPDYYCRETNPGYDAWQARNAIAWNYPFWQNKSFIQKLAAIPDLGAGFPLEMLQARLDTVFNPGMMAPRLEALDDAKIMRKFSRQGLSANEPIYSIYNMDRLGNMKNIEDSSYTGAALLADQDIQICAQSLEKLSRFVSALKSRQIKVVFANTPYLAVDGLDLAKVESSSERFASALSHLAPVIDKRSELIFSRDHFYDFVIHLNAKGRERRTQLLLKHIQAAQRIQQSR